MEAWKLILGGIGLMIVSALGILIWAVRQLGADVRLKKKTGRKKWPAEKGYDRSGYDYEGYTIRGRNAHGQYNRFHDVADYATSRYSADGFLNPRFYPVGVTRHAAQRIRERVAGWEYGNPRYLAMNAYCFGKSARQMKPSAAHVVREIERRHEHGIVLLYDGYVYIFSADNQLITVYPNERIPV